MKHNLRLAVCVTLGGMGIAADAAAGSAPATFYKDALPILEKNCQNCHRAGQIGPMSLLTYEEARPWAKAIKSEVANRKMPPWFADPKFGHFSNDRSLTQIEVETLVKWVNDGALAGDPKDGPAPVAWPEAGWRIKPDVVVKGAEYHVPTSGIMPWLYVTVPTGFKEDTWVTSIEMRPGINPALTHHYCVFFTPHRDDVKYGVYTEQVQGEGTSGGPFEGCYEKGQEEFDFRPQHAGRLVRAGSDMVFQMHYAPNGKANIDQPQIGFTVTKERPARQYAFLNVGAGFGINIAPNQADYKAPAQEGELTVDAEIVWLQAHAHYRAKEMTFNVEYPDGRSETALHVNWNPYWQSLYYPAKPLVAPKGTRLEIEGTYDNSANNVFNPDPSKPVKFGQQAADEMLFPTFGFIVDSSLDLSKVKIVRPSPRADANFTVRDNSTTASK